MKILIDETHNPRGKIFSNYKEFRRLLELNGHEINIYNDFPIKLEALREADVFIFPCCDGSKLFGYEVRTLLRYIEEGHGVLVISHAGGDSGLGTNMNSLTANHFDIEIQSNEVFDEVHCDQELSHQVIIREFADHSITDGLEQICYVAGCSLKIRRKANPVVVSDQDANPENAPLIAAWEGGRNKTGRVVVVGSYRLFSDWGIKKFQNAQLALNICEWLADIRKPSGEEITQEASIPQLSESKEPREPNSSILDNNLIEPEHMASPEITLIPQTSENAAILKKLSSKAEVKPATSVPVPEHETFSETVIKLPVIEKLLSEVKLIRSDLEEIKDLLRRWTRK
ncbi:MAG: hypothetical protein ACE5R6_14675 [Candidatus Heimdallarchaeota archaeon]